MVKIIVINTEGDLIKGVRTLNRVKKRLPKMTREGMRRWGHILEKSMRRSAINAGIADHTHTLLRTPEGIDWRQSKNSNTGYLFMRLYGIYLDSMAPHFVNVTRRRTRLLTWALHADNAGIKAKAEGVRRGKRNKFSLYVKPKPFIRAGYGKARPKLRAVLKRLAARAVATA